MMYVYVYVQLHGQYPVKHRLAIYKHFLTTPDNLAAYRDLINRGTHALLSDPALTSMVKQLKVMNV